MASSIIGFTLVSWIHTDQPCLVSLFFLNCVFLVITFILWHLFILCFYICNHSTADISWFFPYFSWQLVESEYLWKLHDLHNNEAKASDEIHLVPTRKETILRAKSQHLAMHCDAIEDEIKLVRHYFLWKNFSMTIEACLLLLLSLTFIQLSEPFKIFEFDFWRRPESRGETKLRIKAINDGTVHAVVSWYNLYWNIWNLL